MTVASLTTPQQRPRELLGFISIAAMFGVTPNTVYVWISRGNDPDWPGVPPFPEPDYVTRTGSGLVLSWEPEREPEIRAWRKRLPGRGWRKGKRGDPRVIQRKGTSHDRIETT